MALEIRILGTQCPQCDEVERRTINALAELNIAADLQKITDVNAIGSYGVIATPGLVINGKIKSSGRVPPKEKIKSWIREEM